MSAELIVTDRRASAQPDPVAPPPAGPVTPMHMLQVAVAQGADLGKLEQLMALQERWEKNEARKAFVAAMAAFKANPPVIVKNKRVHYVSQKGSVDYVHATHDEVTNKIAAALSPHGLSHRWHVEQVENGQIRVTCIVEHALGHSESVSLTSGRDDSGSKNSIQAVGSAVTYLQRYTLLAVTGLSTSEAAAEDDDGRGAEGAQPAERVEVPHDVRIALQEAAERGLEELKAVWSGVSQKTRDVVVTQHSAWFNGLKSRAREVKP